MRVPRSIPFLTLFCLFTLAAPARPAEKTDARPPDMVMQVKAIDDLIADFKYLAKLAGHDQEFQKGEGFLTMMLGQNHAGIDFKRPIGTYGDFGEGLDATGAILIPISSEKDFLDFLQDKTSQKPEKGDDGIYTMTAPMVGQVYFRFNQGYLYATVQTKTALEKEKMLDPGKVLPPEHAALFRTAFQLDRLPDAAKQMALQGIDRQIEQAKDKEEPGETKIQRQAREKALEDIGKRIGTVVKEGGELRFRIDIDREAGKLRGDLDFSGKAGSSLASDISELGKSQSLFASATDAEDAALQMLIHCAVPENLRQALEPFIEETLQKAVQNEKDEAKRATFKKVIDVLGPTFKSGELDALFALHGPDDEHHYTFVAGVKVKDGKGIEGAIRETVRGLPEQDQKKIKFDAESAGDVKIHRVEIQKGKDEDTRKVLGDHPAYFAVRDDAIIVTAGAGGLDALKHLLEAEAKAGPQFRLDIAMARLAPLMEHEHKNAGEAAKAAFGDAADKDRVHVSVQGGERLTVHFSMDARVITFASKMDHGKKAEKKKEKDDDDDK